MAPMEGQQLSDADLEPGCLDDLLQPRTQGARCDAEVVAGESVLTPNDVGVQADSGSPLPDWARQRIDSFLTGLASGVDQKTLQELLTLLPTLPAPGPTVLLDEIRLRQPELFERLYESMRRTKQRQSAA
ncbi:unnamed protein product [Durusdinium trenchii]|uniref:Uncharacterized protein n=1 Tax=Durusdinium trenchii TaxID=1381693 RepID=A0ABP0KU94_9DINO